MRECGAHETLETNITVWLVFTEESGTRRRCAWYSTRRLEIQDSRPLDVHLTDAVPIPAHFAIASTHTISMYSS